MMRSIRWVQTLGACVLALACCAGIASDREALTERLEALAEDFLRDPAETIADVQALRPQIDASGETDLLGDWHLTMAVVLIAAGENQEALEHSEHAQQLYSSLDDAEGIGDSLLVGAMVKAAFGRYRDVIEDYQRVLEMAPDLEDAKEFEAAAWYGLGDAYAVTGDYASALDALLNAYEIYEELEDEEATSATIALLGNVYSDIDAEDKALAMYAEAVELDRERGQDVNVAVGLYNMGRAHTDLGQYEDARTAFNEALQISQRLEHRVNEGYARYGLGLVGVESGEYGEARAQLMQALELLQAAGDEFQSAMSHYQLGRTAYAEGDYESALQHVDQALGPLREASSDKHLVKVYKLAADIAQVQGRLADALRYERLRSDLMEKFASEERARKTAALRVRLETDQAEDLAARRGRKLEIEQRYTMTLAIATALLLLVIAWLAVSIAKRRALEKELRRLANTDDLTGVLSRRCLFELGGHEVERAQRYELPLALMILDLDFFKSVNDRYGHAAGDAVLIEVARELERQLRDSDLLGRVGGEEFVAVLPHTHPSQAREVAERLCEAISDMDLSSVGVDDRLTMSIGIAMMRPKGDDVSEMIKRADAALYQAKAQGRNQAQIEMVDWVPEDSA